MNCKLASASHVISPSAEFQLTRPPVEFRRAFHRIAPSHDPWQRWIETQSWASDVTAVDVAHQFESRTTSKCWGKRGVCIFFSFVSSANINRASSFPATKLPFTCWEIRSSGWAIWFSWPPTSCWPLSNACETSEASSLARGKSVNRIEDITAV